MMTQTFRRSTNLLFAASALYLATGLIPLSPAQDKTSVRSALDVSRGDLDGKRVVFLGDSITAAGTHIGFIETVLRRQFPDQNFDFYSLGLSSETASGMTEPDHPFPRPCIHERLDRVLTKSKPDYVVACYGMNDGIYHPPSAERAQAYHDGIDKLVKKASQSGATVVLITPPAFDAASAPGIVPKDAEQFGWKTPYENYSQVMAEYGKWLLNLDDVIAIDVHTPLTEWMARRRQTEPEFRNGDGVHPSKVGYMALAVAILDGMGVSVPDATPQAALERIGKDRIYRAVEKRRSQRGKGWMKHTGYVRGPKNQIPEPLGSTEDDAASALEEIRNLNAGR